MVEFKDVTLKSKDEIEGFLKNTCSYSSEFSFANIYAWQHMYKVKYAMVDGALVLLYIAGNGELFLFYPLAKEHADEVFEKVLARLHEQGRKPKIRLWNEKQAELFQQKYGDKVKFFEDDSIEEYVYDREKLATLSGKKLHSKRNFVNRFKSMYDWQYKKMDQTLAKECVGVFHSWLDEKDEQLEGVTEATLKFLDNYEELALTGGCLLADGKIVAFSVGEQICDDVAAVHLEYGDKNYHGVFQAMNQEYVANEWQHVKYINREEDMGLVGLRQAKQSYKPDFMVKKYIAEFL